MILKNIIRYKLRNLYKKENGFSLVEMILVFFIIAIVATIISLLYMSSIRSQKDLLSKAGSEANLRTTMYSISKDVREATSFSSETSSISLKFTADINNDSVFEDVEYILKGETLYKNINGEADKFVMDYITNDTIFRYFSDSSEDSELQPPLDPQDIKMMEIHFIVNQESSNTAPEELSTFVSLRNK